MPLLLLDADNEANDDALRATTDKLYGGDQDHRIKQEILLGVGGVRAVNAYIEATGHPAPEVFHMNEGHAGFLGLQRICSLISDNGLSFSEALSAVRAGTVFTTHTPVPAGIDRFPMDLVRHYLDPGQDGMSRLLPGLGVDEVMALGAEDDPSRFNMAHMGLRLAQRANGVAKLHGEVSRKMFAPLYPGFEPDEVPIGSVTNGVHLPTWAAREMYDVAGDMADWQDLAVGLGMAGRRQGVRASGSGSCAARCGSGWWRWPGPPPGSRTCCAGRRSPSSAGPSRSWTRTS